MYRALAVALTPLLLGGAVANGVEAVDAFPTRDVHEAIEEAVALTTNAMAAVYFASGR